MQLREQRKLSRSHLEDLEESAEEKSIHGYFVPFALAALLLVCALAKLALLTLRILDPCPELLAAGQASSQDQDLPDD